MVDGRDSNGMVGEVANGLNFYLNIIIIIIFLFYV